MEALGTLLFGFVMGFVNLVLFPYHLFNLFRLETLKEQMSVLTYLGQSQEFFFAVLALVLVLVGLGIYKRAFLRRAVYSLEMFNGRIGQFAAWFAILMMLQQVLIIATGQIFRGNDLVFAPLGMVLVDEELQWLSGQLKFYNAILIALASAYTFIEGGHVRVDLIYAATKRRTQLLIDLAGTVFMFIPSTVMLWWFAWPLATNSMFAQRPLNVWSSGGRWRDFKWEGSGTAEFTWVWSFKFLIVVFAGLMFIVAISFLLRNILALLEPEDEIPSHYSFEEEGAPERSVGLRGPIYLGRPAKTPARPPHPSQLAEESSGHGV